MAYSTSSPPTCVSQGIGGGRKLWMYTSTDAMTVVRVADYFSNGYALGMRAGDIICCIDSDASPISASWAIINSASATTCDISDGVAITATDSD